MEICSEAQCVELPQEIGVFVQSIQRTLNSLSDPDRSTRKRALDALHKKLVGSDKALLSLKVLQSAWDDHILHALLKSLNDRVEKCRESAVLLIQDALKIIPDVDKTTLLLLPVMAEKLAQGGTVSENSEEIRLLLMRVLSESLLKRCSDAALVAVVNPVCDVISSGLADSFHDLKKGACQITAITFRRAKENLRPNSEQVLRVLLQNINHTHSRVRIAVLQAIDAVVECGLPAGMAAEELTPTIRSLAFDHSQSVRELFFESVAQWLGFEGNQPIDQGHDRYSYDSNDRKAYIPCLLPLLLLGITDESADIARMSLALVEGVGEAYLVSKEMTTTSSKDESMIEQDRETTPWDGYIYSFPYKGRPGRGCRELVNDFWFALLKPALADLRDWTVVIRLGAARLLHTLLVLAEDRAADKLDVLIPALCVAIGEDELAVVQQVIRVVHVLGYHVSLDLWMDFILDSLTGSVSSDAQRANALVLLAGMLYKCQKQYVNKNSIVQLCRGLSQPEVSLSEHPAVRQQLLAVVTNLVRVGGSLCQSSSFEVCVLLLRLQSGEGDLQLQESARRLSETFANEVEMCSLDKLYEKHMKALIDTVVGDYELWVGNSPERLVFEALLLNAAPSVGAYLKNLLPIFIKSLQRDSDPALRISLLTLLDELFEKLELKPWWTPLAVDVIGKILIPCGVWQVGKVGAAVRHKAMVALGTFLRQDLCSQMDLLQLLQSEQLLPVASSCLEEDFYVDTRNVTAHVFDNILRIAGNVLNEEQRKFISSVLQKRLDDSSDVVRLGVLRAIGTFFHTSPETSNNQAIENFLRNVLVHMGDSNGQIQAAVFQATEVCAYKKPDVVISILKCTEGQNQAQQFGDHLLSLASSIKEGGKSSKS